MTIRLLALLVLALSLALRAQGQQHRTFRCGGEIMPYLAQNNRVENVFSVPGFQVFLVLGDSAQPLEALYARDSLRRIKPSGMGEYACFYYLPHRLAQTGGGFKAIDSFVRHVHREDFIDQNRVFLVAGGRAAQRFCGGMAKDASSFAVKIYCLGDSLCPEPAHRASSAQEIWRHSQTEVGHKTDVYPVHGFSEMEQALKTRRARQNRLLASDFGKKIYVSVAAGPQFIRKGQRAAFDTATLVDFTEHKTVWSLSGGYYVRKRLGVSAGFSFLYSGKQKQLDSIDWDNPDGIKITGSGKAAAMYRYGVGLRFVPLSHPRGSIVMDVFGGGQRAIAGGGTATRIIGGGSGTNEIAKQKQAGHFLSVSVGGLFMLGPMWGLGGNLSYNHAPLEAPIGSVEGFSGLSCQFGLSVYFNTRNAHGK